MKKNTNSRKISLLKNNLWKKHLRRKERLFNRINESVDNNEEYLEEINLLFPNLHSENKNIDYVISDKEKNIFTVNVSGGLFDNDILAELNKYKHVPMKGFRQISKKPSKAKNYSQLIQRKLGSLTLMDFRYGAQVRESLVYTKYFHEAKDKIIADHNQLKDLINAPFNLSKDKNCSFNIIFYENKSTVDENIQEFMMKNPTKNNDKSTVEFN